MGKYFLYILRWVVLAIPGALFFNKVSELFEIQNVYAAMLISQAMLGAMVYFIDKLIFTSGAVSIPWETRRHVACVDCGRVGTCYRVSGDRCCNVKEKEGTPGFRCEDCEAKKLQQLENR
jgi:hypothetical protein